MDDRVRAIVARIADGRAVQIFMFIMPFSVRIRTNTCRINAGIEYIIDLGQMVSISRYHDTTRYRYQTIKVSTGLTIIRATLFRFRFPRSHYVQCTAHR